MKALEQAEVARLRTRYEIGTGVRDTAVELRLSVSTVSKYFAVFRGEQRWNQSNPPSTAALGPQTARL